MVSGGDPTAFPPPLNCNRGIRGRPPEARPETGQGLQEFREEISTLEKCGPIQKIGQCMKKTATNPNLWRLLQVHMFVGDFYHETLYSAYITLQMLLARFARYFLFFSLHILREFPIFCMLSIFSILAVFIFSRTFTYFLRVYAYFLSIFCVFPCVFLRVFCAVLRSCLRVFCVFITLFVCAFFGSGGSGGPRPEMGPWSAGGSYPDFRNR